MRPFVLNASSYHRYVTTPKGNKYSFFAGENTRPVLVKDKDDIKWFKENIEFTEVTEMTPEEIKQVEENEKAAGETDSKDKVEKQNEGELEKPLKDWSLEKLKKHAKELRIAIEGKPSKKALIALIKNYISTTD